MSIKFTGLVVGVARFMCGMAAGAEKSRVLILSGANNHDWKQTTPAIRAALEATGRFQVDVEENVIAMKPESFTPYAVLLEDATHKANFAMISAIEIKAVPRN